MPMRRCLGDGDIETRACWIYRSCKSGAQPSGEETRREILIDKHDKSLGPIRRAPAHVSSLPHSATLTVPNFLEPSDAFALFREVSARAWGRLE